MILRPFILLTFVKKESDYPPFFHFWVSFVYQLDLAQPGSTWLNLATRLSAQLSAELSAQLSTRLSAQLSVRLSAQLSARFLMLPNLTNHYIKLSDGDLQCEWNLDIFKNSFCVKFQKELHLFWQKMQMYVLCWNYSIQRMCGRIPFA